MQLKSIMTFRVLGDAHYSVLISPKSFLALPSFHQKESEPGCVNLVKGDTLAILAREL